MALDSSETKESFDLRRFIFRMRSYTPIPFLAVMVLFARPTAASLIAGFAVLLLGEALRFWGVSIAGAETRTTGTVGGTYLITNGPFAFVRNPLYLGNLLVYAGIGVMSMALFPWLLAGAMIWFYVQYFLIVTREEEYLRERFNGEYEQYCRSVHRFIPRLSPYKPATPPPKTVNATEGLASERRTLQAIGLVTVALFIIFLIR